MKSKTACTTSVPRLTTASSIDEAYGTGASSMARRRTGASSKSKHCSWISAETVAPTPPEFVLSSRMVTLCVRASERLERAHLDEIDVEPLSLNLGQYALHLLEAVQVGEHRHRLARRHCRVGGLVHQLALVDWHAPSNLGVSLDLLHHLDWEKQEARPVVPDHRLHHAVGRVGRGGRPDLEARDAHDVCVEGLRVLGAQRLVGRGAAGAHDGERHLELATSSGVRVAGRRDLGHGVDGEVGVHHLHNRPVAVHALTQRLAQEVTLVDDLVGAAQRAKRLLRQLRDVVRGPGLQVLGVADGGRVAQHLLEHGQVDRVGDADLALDRQRLQLCHVRLARRQPLGVGRPLGHLCRVGHDAAGVVIRVWRVGELELLCQLGRGRRRLAREVEGLLDDSLGRL
eukprot:scaffold3810_cov120-Isochrysis_galbana.AAC.6